MHLKIGELIKNRRSLLRLTQEDLSQMSGVGMSTIHQIEKGVGNPSYQTLERLFQILGLEFIVQIKNTN
ncbi:helix-turn-helix transcriptional regulator [Pedobacter gandavensis]|uniref:helix-turn-helix domain-containing protein n=1 Tax=Pedobacter gandavensis TaxID=2679963 RepID=UPI00292D8B00|nr:helix-turn-helix transcriptional regulator [Pedobacter gandavensis]